MLLLEDDAVLLQILQEVLEEEGLAVTVSRSFFQTCAAAASGQFALAVVDGWGESSFQLEELERQQLQQLARLVPTILVSGRVWAQHAAAEELGLAAGYSCIRVGSSIRGAFQPAAEGRRRQF